MNKTLWICATALLVASCSKETVEMPEAEPRGIIFSATQNNDTRTTLDGVNILWQRDDAVGIFSPQIAKAVNYKAVVAEEDHGRQYASLRTDLNYGGSGKHTFYAYYPYAEGQSSASTVKGSISASQNGEIGSNAFMWATAEVDPTAMPRVDLLFKHPFTYLNIQLRATGAYRDAVVEQICIEAANGKTLAGEFKTDLIKGTVTFTTHERAVRVTPAAAALGDDYLNTLAVVNAEDLTGTDFIVSVTLRQNGNAVKLRTVKAGRRLYPQTKVNLKLTAEEMETDRSDDAIEFADATAEAICLEHWDTNGDGRLSYKEAADVQRLDGAFEGSIIHSFDELQYFRGLTSIGNAEFQSCSNMRSITIPENIVSIRDSAFWGCSTLKSFTMHDNVTYLGESAFYGAGIEHIVLSNNITEIKQKTFAACRNLKSITIPEKVTKLGYNVFSVCDKLTDITIVNGIETIPRNCFSSCSSLKHIEIGSGVKLIEEESFWRCSSLTDIVLPENVTSIEKKAFAECTGLKSIVIPAKVMSIGDSVFDGCTSLESATLPDKISVIGDGVFHGCVNLKTFNWKYVSEDRRCLIRDGELIAFAPASLNKYTIPEGVTSMRKDVFADCVALESISIPQTVTTIGDGVFGRCTALKSITIPDSVTEIGDGTFIGCVGMTNVTVSKNVIAIGSSAFQSCSALTDVYCRARTPPTCGKWAFRDVNTTANLYVPTESVERYSTDNVWKGFFFRISGYDYGDL